jgi:hypothetical protein
MKRFKRTITRIEYKDLKDGDFRDISNFKEIDEMYLEDQFYKLLTITKGRKVILKKIIAWGYDGHNPEDRHGLKEYMLADYVYNKKYSPYDGKELCI